MGDELRRLTGHSVSTVSLAESTGMALRSLRTNVLRSTLTALGIVIGVAAVILLVGLGDGMKNNFRETFEKFSTQITVTKMSRHLPGAGPARELREGDAIALGQLPRIKSVAPIAYGAALIRYGQEIADVSVVGSTVSYLVAENQQVVHGGMFSNAHVSGNARVVVLGSELADRLAPGDAASIVGDTVRISRINFRVVGVLGPNGERDSVALMPLGSAALLSGGGNKISQINVVAESIEAVDQVVAGITDTMDSRHNIKDRRTRDFEVAEMRMMIEQSSRFMNVLAMFVASIGGISLVVGAIGIANIMLVSVTERTREIGIRKAVGARRRSILVQFLVEASILAGLGGVVGIVLGVILVLSSAELLPRLAPDFGIPVLSPGIIVISFGISVAIGVLAGWYPARRAARLRPIDALRHQ